MWDKLLENITDVRDRLLALPNTDQRFIELWSVNAAPISARNLASAIYPLIQKIKLAIATNLPADDVESILNMVVMVRDSYVANLYAHPQAHLALLSTFQTIDGILTQTVGATELISALNIPAQILSKTSASSRKLQLAMDGLDRIDEKIAQINLAHEAALNLPITQSELEEAKKEVERTRIAVAAQLIECEKLVASVNAEMKKMEAQATHATTVAGKVDGAYRALTSQGLAKAFSLKENALRTSMHLWVFCLLAALFAGGIIGYHRFPAILEALRDKPDWGIILADVTLAALSLGAPIWFATVATKQISQRFRLSEDYAYKAAISAAYEGYRAEAERFGDAFQTRLFTSTLDRLDEQPLRFVEDDQNVTPLHHAMSAVKDLTDSKAAKAFMEQLSALADRISGKSAKKDPTD